MIRPYLWQVNDMANKAGGNSEDLSDCGSHSFLQIERGCTDNDGAGARCIRAEGSIEFLAHIDAPS